MKPEDIIKALRCSATPGEHDCTGCPYLFTEKLNAVLAKKFGCEEVESCDCDKIALDAAELLEAYHATNHTPEECAAAFEERDNYKILRADADRIREGMMQKELMLISDKMRLEKELAVYRDAEPELAVEDIAYAYLQICEKDCAGDCTTGIPPCRFYNPPDVGLFGEPLPFGCELEDYCEYRSEAALKEQEGQK